MVLKTAPDVHGRNVTCQIGAPQDYTKNAESGDFPQHYDLQIPGARRSAADHLVDEADIAGALGDSGHQSGHEEAKTARRSYEASGQLARASKAEPADMYMPIKALNQFSHDWVIKARVVKKGDIRSWKNAKGEGRLFNIDLVDREGTLIQATAFNETAEKYAEMLEQDQVYTFMNGTVKLANKRFTSIKNDYCLTFDYSTVIEACADDAQIKGDGFSFTKLNELEAIVQNCTVDVIGVIFEVGMTSMLNLKDGGQRAKRTLQIGDESNISI